MVVITCVVVVQLVGQRMVEVMNTVTVPTTYAEVHVVQDGCESSTVAEGVQRPLLLYEREGVWLVRVTWRVQEHRRLQAWSL